MAKRKKTAAQLDAEIADLLERRGADYDAGPHGKRLSEDPVFRVSRALRENRDFLEWYENHRPGHGEKIRELREDIARGEAALRRLLE